MKKVYRNNGVCVCWLRLICPKTKYPNATPKNTIPADMASNILNFNRLKLVIINNRKPIYTGIEKIFDSFERSLNIFF